jgi:peptide deformylase
MAVLPLIYYGNPLLKKKSKEVKDIASIGQLVNDMFETMYEKKGLGLAAVQVGELLNVFIMNASQDPEKNEKGIEEVFINPKVTKIYGEESEIEEGCLCIPELHGNVIRENVKRKSKVDIEYMDRNGNKRVEKGVEGLRARAIQHEIDHLDGILFVDRLSLSKKLVLKKTLKNIAREYS